MADETIVEANETAAAEPVSAKPKTRAPRKKAEPKAASAKPAAKATKAPKAAKAASAPKAAKVVATVAAPAGRQVKRYTPAERASILASVEKATKGGKTTLKAALQHAEVSEQTYYNWKNAAGKTAAPAAAKASPTSDDLKALVALEAENLKLRKELAAKLRSENTELRKRLGKA